MLQPQDYMAHDPRDDNFGFEQPRIALLNEKHWLHIQRRYHMSPRELQVARLVCQGLRNDEIARDLHIKHGTVKTHIRNIYRRIRVKNKIAMLLKFISDASRFSAKYGTAPPIPIAEVAKPGKKAPSTFKVPPK